MHYTISPDRRTLTIYADEADRRALRGLGEEIGTNDNLRDAFEHLVCNSELEWVSPAICCDLTDAPILGMWGEQVERADAGEVGSCHVLVGHWAGKTWGAPVTERWGFMSYALRSPLEDLRDKGQAVFIAP